MAPPPHVARWPRRDRALVLVIAGLGPWIGFACFACIARALGVL